MFDVVPWLTGTTPKGEKERIKHICREINLTENSGVEKLKLNSKIFISDDAVFWLQFTPDIPNPSLAQVNIDDNRWFGCKEGRCAKKLEYPMQHITEVIKSKYYDLLVLVFFKTTCKRNGLVYEEINPSMVVCQRIETCDKYEKREINK